MRSFHSIHNDVDGGVLQAMWGANLYTTINTHYLPTMPILCKRSIEERPLGGGHNVHEWQFQLLSRFYCLHCVAAARCGGSLVVILRHDGLELTLVRAGKNLYSF